MNSIYDYLDYREFLKDRLALLKAKGPAFSIRNLNRRSGLKSSGHLSLIVSGKRNLGRDAMYKVCRGLGLTEKETQFFVSLVNFNRARTAEEKNHFYKLLLRAYPPKHAKIINSKHYNMFSEWYYVPIMELARTHDFRPDPSWISGRLKPKVSATKVKNAIDDLLHLGLMKKNADRIEPVDKMIATPDVVRSVLVTNYQERLTRLAVESLKKDPVDDKEFSTLTIAVAKDDVVEIKRRMQEMKRELHAFLESSESKKTDVVHINLQMFKLTSGGNLP